MLRQGRLGRVVERLRRLRSHRGSVMVMVAAGLPAFVFLTAFAVDVAHFFDYSRNLQNRADAAALAAGAQFGATCFASTPSQALMDGIGMTAQQYSGPPPGTPDGNLPYTQAQMTDGGQQPYYNQPNLTKGTPSNYHVLLNAKDYYPNGSDWAMGTVCSATDENGVTAPMVDVRVTQANLGLFFPLINVQPNISAHARVELEGAAGTGIVTPIAVRDSNVKCLEANFVDTSTGNPINSSPVPLTKEGQDSSNGATIWDIPNGTSLTMPATAGDNVYVQVVANDCASGGSSPTYYDSSSGVLLINNYPSSTPGTLPAIDTGGVVLTGTCAPDQYFSTSDCSVDVTAHVAFPSTATGEKVTAVDHYISVDPTTNTAMATTQTVTLSNNPSGSNTWTSDSPLTIVDSSNNVFNIGRHQIEITWTDNSGSGSFGVQQQAFSACDSSLIPANCTDSGTTSGNDSGPIQLAQLSVCNPGCSGSGANAFAAGTTHTLGLKVETGTISDATPGRPPTILRFSEQGANQTFTSHATGLINCGQGSGNSASIQAVVTGCPAAGTSACPALSTNNAFDYCAPLAINLRSNQACTPAGNQLGSSFTPRTLSNPGVPVDCFQTVGGSKSPIPQGIACRIIAGSSVNNSGCVTPPGKNACSSNNWSTTEGAKYISAGDPRAMVMAISAPEDLSQNNEVVPIHNFGVFYVTGWDTKGSMSKYSCDPNLYAAPPNDSNGNPAPVENSNDTVSNPLQGEVWGYWIKDTIPYAIPSGTPCDPALFGACTPALTR